MARCNKFYDTADENSDIDSGPYRAKRMMLAAATRCCDSQPYEVACYH